MFSHSLSRALFATLCVGILWVSPAAAQGVGVRAGVGADPDQFYFGIHDELGPVATQLWFRPNAELGVGDHTTQVALNLEFARYLPLRRSEWRPYVGGGPGLVVTRRHRDTKTGGGFNLMVGVAHRGGLFTELKVGFVDSPAVKVGVGYTFR